MRKQRYKKCIERGTEIEHKHYGYSALLRADSRLRSA